jgi:hypothetical protein
MNIIGLDPVNAFFIVVLWNLSVQSNHWKFLSGIFIGQIEHFNVLFVHHFDGSWWIQRTRFLLFKVNFIQLLIMKNIT